MLLEAMNKAKETGHKFHVMGLLSDGGVHSHMDHLLGLLRLAKKEGLSEVYIHAFLDGRDTPPQSAGTYLKALQDATKEIGIGKIATVSGRYYAMDRDKRWERIQKAYDAMTGAESLTAPSALEGLQAAYERGVTDEFVEPFPSWEKKDPLLLAIALCALTSVPTGLGKSPVPLPILPLRK